MNNSKLILALVVVSVLLCGAVFMWATKPVKIINTGTERIEELQQENMLLQQMLIDSLSKQEAYFNAKLEYSDSVIEAKRINNWNLIVRHEKELEKYRCLPTDSIYVRWIEMSVTDGYE